MNEQQIRDIVQNELQKNYYSGSPNVPPHSHNGTDGLNVDPVDLIGWTALPTTQQVYIKSFQNAQGTIFQPGVGEYGFASATQLLTGVPSYPNQFLTDSTIRQYPIPIVNGYGVGANSGFNGGYAPDGTLVYFNNASAGGLYIRIDGFWRGVNFNLTA
jgi:hypothetical protein